MIYTAVALHYWRLKCIHISIESISRVDDHHFCDASTVIPLLVYNLFLEAVSTGNEMQPDPL